MTDAPFAEVARLHSLPRTPVQEPAWPGVMNSVELIGTWPDQYVIRARRGEQAAAEFSREAWCAGAARAAGIETPPILFWGSFSGWSYSVQQGVQGTSAEHHRDIRLWSHLGEVARQIGSIDLTGAPADLFSRFGRDLPLAWRRQVEFNVAALSAGDPLIELGVYGSSDVEPLRRALSALLNIPSDHGLVHGDLALRNLIITPEGIPVLIDWGSVRTGPTPYLDLVNLLRNQDEQDNPRRAEIYAFVAGFGLDPHAAHDWARLTRLLQSFDVLRWAIDKAPDRVPSQVVLAQRLCREALPRLA